MTSNDPDQRPDVSDSPPSPDERATAPSVASGDVPRPRKKPTVKPFTPMRKAIEIWEGR